MLNSPLHKQTQLKSFHSNKISMKANTDGKTWTNTACSSSHSYNSKPKTLSKKEWMVGCFHTWTVSQLHLFTYFITVTIKWPIKCNHGNKIVF